MDSIQNLSFEQLPLYKSHKKVRAAKISRIEVLVTGWRNNVQGKCDTAVAKLHFEPVAGKEVAAVKVSGSYMEKHNPHEGGYYVVYEDGYASWSPDKAFEEGYTLA